ncbi:MAG: translation elongation factor [Thermoproteus sp.]
MLRGSISVVLSDNMEKALEVAGRLGKKEEEKMYYRHRDGMLRTVLTPDGLLEAAEFITLSTYYYLYITGANSNSAELALLAKASGLRGVVLADDVETFRKYFGELGLELGELEEVDITPEDMGYVYIEKAFNVRGVGPVAIGFAFTHLGVHDRLVALPSGIEVDVKSIQVLDEDQKEVGPGTRVGIALRGIEVDVLKESYILVKRDIPLTDRYRIVKFRWASEAEKAHVFIGGIKAIATINGQEAVLDKKVPATLKRGVVVNVNAKPKTSKTYGYVYKD